MCSYNWRQPALVLSCTYEKNNSLFLLSQPKNNSSKKFRCFKINAMKKSKLHPRHFVPKIKEGMQVSYSCHLEIRLVLHSSSKHILYTYLLEKGEKKKTINGDSPFITQNKHIPLLRKRQQSFQFNHNLSHRIAFQWQGNSYTN